MFGRKRPWSWLDKNDVILLAQVTHHVQLPIQDSWPTFLHIIIKQCTNQKKSERPTFVKLYDLIFINALQEKSFVNPSLFKASAVRMLNDIADNKSETFPNLDSKCPDAVMNERVSRVQFSDANTTAPTSNQEISSGNDIQQPKKSCLRGGSNLRSSLIKKAIISNKQMEHLTCDKHVITAAASAAAAITVAVAAKQSRDESVEKLINIQTVDSNLREANKVRSLHCYFMHNHKSHIFTYSYSVFFARFFAISKNRSRPLPVYSATCLLCILQTEL